VAVGDYVIEYGWLNEPPVAGQPNAVIINISGSGSTEGAGHNEDVSAVISLVAPTDDSAVNGDTLDVTVQIEGLDEHQAEEMHWHLYVDDQTLAMPPASQTTATVTGLSSGEHVIKVALAAADHQEVGEPAHAKITVEGSSATGSPSVAGAEPLAGAGENGHAEGIEVDVSGLKVEVLYGGESKELELQPLAEGLPGQFVAPLTPTRPGQYTLRITGKLTGELGEAEADLEIEPEEIESADAYQFPAVEAQQQSGLGLTDWLGTGGLAAGLLGLIFSLVALTRKK
ncbi:MAG: hypothetical protein AAB217_26590, partial [Chloroflexota bacterium]